MIHEIVTLSALINNIDRWADLIERDLNILASLETLDNGKSFEDSIFDIQCSADFLR